jgi:predicted ATP-grasp superfamily ATP-dependent carboligase
MPFHIAAFTIVGTAHGTTTIARNSQRPRISAWSRAASPRPSSSSRAVETTVKYIVRPMAAQNPASVSTDA